MPRSGKASPSPRPRRATSGSPPSGPAEDAIIIFARAPVPGAVKTRMCPPLTPDEAATLHGSLVMDAVERTRSLRGFDIYVACTPGMEHPFFQTLAARHRIRLCDQVGADLGQRMDHALTNVLNRGCRSALLVGTDIPALAHRHYRQAQEALRSHDVVLGPTEDGGYYLVGITRPLPALFAGIPWATDRVFTQSLAQAEQLGLAVGLLNRERDIDTFHDLQAFVRDQTGPGQQTLTTRTGNVFQALIQRYEQPSSG